MFLGVFLVFCFVFLCFGVFFFVFFVCFFHRESLPRPAQNPTFWASTAEKGHHSGGVVFISSWGLVTWRAEGRGGSRFVFFVGFFPPPPRFFVLFLFFFSPGFLFFGFWFLGVFGIFFSQLTGLH